MYIYICEICGDYRSPDPMDIQLIYIDMTLTYHDPWTVPGYIGSTRIRLRQVRELKKMPWLEGKCRGNPRKVLGKPWETMVSG